MVSYLLFLFSHGELFIVFIFSWRVIYCFYFLMVSYLLFLFSHGELFIVFIFSW